MRRFLKRAVRAIIVGISVLAPLSAAFADAAIAQPNADALVAGLASVDAKSAELQSMPVEPGRMDIIPARAAALESVSVAGAVSVRAIEPPRQPNPQLVSTLRVKGYHASSTEIRGGNTVELSVQLINETILTERFPQTSLVNEVKAFEVKNVGGAFSVSAKPRIVIDSQPGEPLLMTLTFSGCVYSGKGNVFRFQLGYTDFPDLQPDTVEVTVTECKETPPVVPEGKEPVLMISRSDIATPISAEQTLTLQLTVTNLSKTTTAVAPILTLTTSSELMLAEKTSTFPLQDISPEGKQTVDVKIKALSELTSQSQTLEASVKFTYEVDGKQQDGTALEKITIPAIVKNPAAGGTAYDAGVGRGGGSYTPVDSPVPNVIISRYTYGNEPQIAVGSHFTLSLDFFNTSSKIKVENLIMTVDPGEGLALNASCNTFFFNIMKKGEKISQEIPMMVLPSIKGNTQDVTITFKYEYVDHRKRTAVTLPQKISIPVYQPDRFEVTAPTLPATITAGEETTISLPFFNKGKSDVSNVSAKLEGEVNALSKLLNLGNFEPGKSGTIDFILTPDKSGSVPITVNVSYETSSGEAKNKEFPLVLTINEAIPEPDPAMSEGEKTESPAMKNGSLVLLVICGMLIIAAIVIVVLRIRRKRMNSHDKIAFQWDAGDATDDEKAEQEGTDDADA